MRIRLFIDQQTNERPATMSKEINLIIQQALDMPREEWAGLASLCESSATEAGESRAICWELRTLAKALRDFDRWAGIAPFDGEFIATSDDDDAPFFPVVPGDRMPKEQLETAWRLGSAYGHEWASLLVKYLIRLECPLNAPLIARGVATERVNDWAGAEAPWTDNKGRVVHQTGTGRLVWCIAVDGTTTLTVSRPLGLAFAVVVPVSGALTVQRLVESYGLRHIQAAQEALRALRGTSCEACDDAVESLKASADPETVRAERADHVATWGVEFSAYLEQLDSMIARFDAEDFCQAREQAPSKFETMAENMGFDGWC